MNGAVRYLEEAELERLAGTLRAEGYEVRVPGSLLGETSAHDVVDYDLVATKGTRRIAVEVTARSRLADSAERLARLRMRAREEGYDDFRLVVVNPPPEKRIEVEGFEDALFQHLVNDTPAKLSLLSSSTRIEGVERVDSNVIELSLEAVRVSGTGIIEVLLEYGGGEARDGVSWSTDFPFDFDVELELGGDELRISAVHELNVDTSGFSE